MLGPKWELSRLWDEGPPVADEDHYMATFAPPPLNRELQTVCTCVSTNRTEELLSGHGMILG